MTATNEMDIVVLGAGYGTRLQRDLSASLEYQHLLNVPKALLPLGGRPLLDHWLSDPWILASSSPLFVAVNALYAPLFRRWASQRAFPEDRISVNTSTSNDDRLGSVADLSRTIQHFALGTNRPVMILAGDTLFHKGTSLEQLVHAFSSFPLAHNGQHPILVTCYPVSSPDQVKSSGILVLDNVDSNGHGNVAQFLEKPLPSETPSRLACPLFYILPPACIPLLETFLKEKSNGPLSERDATGKWIAWLVGKYPLRAVPISGRLDIGGLDSYIAAEAYISSSSAEK